MRIVRTERVNNTVFRFLDNGWHIFSAACSRDRQGLKRFSLWRPDKDAWGGSKCIGGAETLKACMEEADRMAPARSPAPSLFGVTE